MLARFRSQIPTGQFLRFLLVGTWNTLFGYAAYVLLTATLAPLSRYSYLIACVLASFLSITVAFLGYKWFVFKTKGNYLREWARCVMVYSGGIVAGFLMLPVLVIALRRMTGLDASAPYVAGALISGGNVLYNFVGHRRFSFRTTTKEQPVQRRTAGDNAQEV